MACALVFALVGWIPSLAGVPETLLSSLLKGCVSGLVGCRHLASPVSNSLAPSLLLASLLLVSLVAE